MVSPHVRTTSALLQAHDGVVTARQLRVAGVSTAQVAGLVRDGTLLRLRRDVLVDRRRWESTPGWERHALRARGTLASLDPGGTRPLALSHHSALALRGVPLHGVDEDVHLVRVGEGRGHRSRGLHVHAPVPAALVQDASGLRAVTPAAAVLQVTASFGIPSGLVAADAAVRQGLCTRDDLTALLEWSALRTARAAVAVVAERADGRHESPGESRCAWVLSLLGLRFEPQVVLRTRDGTFVARVDFYLREHRVVVEFDGMTKYTDPVVVRREKVREDRIRALGFPVVRLTWADLDDLAAARRRLDAAIGLSRGRPA